MDTMMQRLLDEMSLMETRITKAKTGSYEALEQRVKDFEEKKEVCLISLEMDQGETEPWRLGVERRLDNMSLELTRATKFMERESMVQDFTKPGLIPTSSRRTSAHLLRIPPSTGQTTTASIIVTGSVGLGEIFPNQGPVKGTFHEPAHVCFDDTSDQCCFTRWDGAMRSGVPVKGICRVRISHNSTEIILNHGKRAAKTTLIGMILTHLNGSALLICISKEGWRVGSNQLSGASRTGPGRNFALKYTIVSVVSYMSR
jgi:hypothetical protein